MKIAYCVKCNPVAVVAIGAVPSEVVIRGKKKAVKPPSHAVKGEVHEAKLAEVPELPRLLGEALDAYLKRVVDANKAVLV